jgi:hypothetical protein
MADAPRPWTARAATSTPSAGAAAQAAEPMAKAASPRVKILRAPMRSAVDPAVSMIEARASVYASTTHCSPASEPPISPWMAGNATFTIVTSSWMTKKPRQTDMRDDHVASASVAPAGWVISCPASAAGASSAAAAHHRGPEPAQTGSGAYSGR